MAKSIHLACATTLALCIARQSLTTKGIKTVLFLDDDFKYADNLPSQEFMTSLLKNHGSGIRSFTAHRAMDDDLLRVLLKRCPRLIELTLRYTYASRTPHPNPDPESKPKPDDPYSRCVKLSVDGLAHLSLACPPLQKLVLDDLPALLQIDGTLKEIFFLIQINNQRKAFYCINLNPILIF